MSGIKPMCVAYGTIPLGQLLRGTLRIEDEEKFYWSLDENSRECSLHLSIAVENAILRGGIITPEVTLSSMMDTGKITTQPTMFKIKCQ